MSRLVSRQVSPSVAEDIVADVFSELVVPRKEGAPPLLAKYSGQSSLAGWLNVVVNNRWLDYCRRQKHQVSLVREPGAEYRADTAERDLPLRQTIVAALKHSFAVCEPEAVVMLRLVFVNGVSQRDVARIWGWHESKVSRYLKRGMSFIREETLRFVKSSDAGLDIDWDDIMAVCMAVDLNRIIGHG